jgi:hypothetical protein
MGRVGVCRLAKTSVKFRTFVFFVTFCSNVLGSLLFDPLPTILPPPGKCIGVGACRRLSFGQNLCQIPYLRFLCYLLFKWFLAPFCLTVRSSEFCVWRLAVSLTKSINYAYRI